VIAYIEQETPTIVTLCGSTKFRDAFEHAQRAETLAGKIVLTVGYFNHAENEDTPRNVKAKLDVLHFRKIEISDEILVLDVDGYIGESTEREIEYAESIGVDVRYLSQAVK
jgi:hypothetical protein